MFTQKITDTDAFTCMSLSSQALYFHLCMHADDDGFVSNPRKVQRSLGANDGDVQSLLDKRFILAFESGVIVIKHWRMHNLLRGDRYKETSYSEEMSLLKIKKNGSYTFDDKEENIKDIQNIEKPEWQKRRKEVMDESNLPYSFSYKIRHAFYGKICPSCGSEMREKLIEDKKYGESPYPKPTIQHNKPISLGGKHELGNISVICHTCNVSFRNKDAGDFNSQEVIDVWNAIVNQSAPQVRLGKVSIGNKDNVRSDERHLSGKPDLKAPIEYLNKKANTSFNPKTKSNQCLIKARYNEGRTLEDFKTVIDRKVAQWLTNDKMVQYLRPSTLFRATNFENYLNEKVNNDNVPDNLKRFLQ